MTVNHDQYDPGVKLRDEVTRFPWQRSNGVERVAPREREFREFTWTDDGKCWKVTKQ